VTNLSKVESRKHIIEEDPLLNAKKRFEPEPEFSVFLPDVVFITAVARSAG
jgi:hypothetical protein